MTLNKVILIGNVGKVPEKEVLPSGAYTLKMSIATSSSYKQGEEWKEKTEWHNIVAFGDLAEKFTTTKGSSVYVEGMIQTNTYEKDGKTNYFTTIKAQVLKNMTLKETPGDDL